LLIPSSAQRAQISSLLNAFDSSPFFPLAPGRPFVERRRVVAASTAGEGAPPLPTPKVAAAPLKLFAGAAVAAVAAAALWTVTGGGSGPLAAAIDSAKVQLAASFLARSGFLAAFSLIFASEIGDKTFFIAALLAMRLGKWVSFLGSVSALTIMTAVSVGIGYVVKSVPAAVRNSEVFGQWLGAALLAYFGFRTLQDAWAAPSEGDGDELEEAQGTGEKSGDDMLMAKNDVI
jgi:hypothetical protein